MIKFSANILALALSAKHALAQMGVSVFTPSGGRVLGLSQNGVDSFLGIQYAEVGERFSRSNLLDFAPSNDDINATSFGPNCHQGYPGMPSFLHQPRNEVEECLFLNVWRPSNWKDDEHLPVMVWIHGGGFMVGSGADQVHNGANLARNQNVIVVSLNYRLGALGFLPQDENGLEAMNGLYDQIMALKWVQSNIALFGGDENKVTVFGESAGSESICMLSVSPLAKGLFKRAIMQSGDCINNPWMRGVPNTDFDFALGAVDNLKTAMNVSSFDELRDASRVDARNLNYMSAMAGWSVIVLDKEIIPEHPKELYQTAGNIVPMDFLVGSNSREDVTFMMVAPEEYLQLAQHGLNHSVVSLVGSKFGKEVAQAALAAYDSESLYGDDKVAAFNEFHSDWYIGCPTRAFASTVANSLPGNMYLYSFSHFSLADPVVHYGLSELVDTSTWASHMAMTPFVFGTLDFWSPANKSVAQEDVMLSQEIMARFANFAKHGDPTSGAGAWEPLRPAMEGKTSSLRASSAVTLQQSTQDVQVLVFSSGSSQLKTQTPKEAQCAVYPYSRNKGSDSNAETVAPETTAPGLNVVNVEGEIGTEPASSTHGMQLAIGAFFSLLAFCFH